MTGTLYKLSRIGEIRAGELDLAVKLRAGEPIEIPTRLDVDALLVHEGTFLSQNAGKVTIKRTDLEGIVGNHATVVKLAKRRLGRGTPIQVSHSDSASDTVGRLNSDIELRDAEVEGEKVAALFGTLTFLGRDNVERVLDGRWAELSGGIVIAGANSELIEESVVPFPAVAGASVLAADFDDLAEEEIEPVRGLVARLARESWEIYSIREAMHRALEAFTVVIEFLFTDTPELSDEERQTKAEAAVEDLLRVLESRVRGIFPEATLSLNMEATNMSKLPEGALSAEQAQELNTQLEDQKKQTADLSTEKASLEAQVLRGQLATGLDWLLAAGKITPAERKEIDLEALAGKGRDVVEATLAAHASRSGKALDLTQHGDPTKGAAGDGADEAARLEHRKRLRERFGAKPEGGADLAQKVGTAVGTAIAEALAE